MLVGAHVAVHLPLSSLPSSTSSSGMCLGITWGFVSKYSGFGLTSGESASVVGSGLRSPRLHTVWPVYSTVFRIRPYVGLPCSLRRAPVWNINIAYPNVKLWRMNLSTLPYYCMYRTVKLQLENPLFHCLIHGRGYGIDLGRVKMCRLCAPVSTFRRELSSPSVTLPTSWSWLTRGKKIKQAFLITKTKNGVTQPESEF